MVFVKVMDITPEIAQELMNANAGNRRLESSAVDMYADDLVHGRWHENGQPFTVSNGVLKNGQHRCAAIIKTGITIRNAVVVYTDDPEMIDTQRTRTVRDLSGIDNLSSSAINIIIRMARGRKSGRVSKAETIEVYEKMRHSARFVVDKIVGTNQNGLRKAGVIGACIAAHYQGYPSDDLEAFITAYKSGYMSRDIDKTAIVLRNTALAMPRGGGYIVQRQMYLKAQAALKAYSENKCITRCCELKEAYYKPNI